MMYKSPWIALTIVLSVLLVLVACTGTATPTTPKPTPTPTPLAVSYPVTVTDMLARSVSITQRPARIVSISPTATEMLYRIGATAVGRDTNSKFPAEAQSLPTVGGAYSPSVEAIVALKPDLVLIEALVQGRLAEALKATGAPVLAVRATNLDDVIRSLETLGVVTDRRPAATQAIAQIRSRVEAVAASATAGKKVLVLISDAERNLYAAKPESYAGNIASTLKLTNVAAGRPDSGPYPGFTLFSAEQAIISNPDVILTISPAPPPAPTLSSLLPRVPGYGDLAAVKGGRVKELSPDLFLTAPGPRIADAGEEMLRLLRETSQ